MRGWQVRFQGYCICYGYDGSRLESLQGPVGKVGTCDELIRRDFSQHVKQKEVGLRIVCGVVCLRILTSFSGVVI